MIAALILAAVTSIHPTVGPDSGGTLVTIRGTELSTPVNCILPCPPRVVFGDTAVDAIEKSDTEMQVVTPAHVAGTVDLRIQIAGRDEIRVPNGFTFYDDAQDGYEEILVPIFIDGIVPGAHGTQWQTDFRLRNQGSGPATIAHYQCPLNLACPPVFPLTYTLLPGQSLPKSAKFAGTRSNPSLMLYVREPSDVAMSLRVADISRGTLNAGTDVPVIRESELLTGNAQLFNVPMNNGDRFRILLRVYAPAMTKADFQVRIHPDDEFSEPLHITTLTATTPQEGAFRTESAYAELDFTELLRLKIAWPASARIEVRPLVQGSRYWTFLSLTNNETQLVTLVTPQ